MEAPRAHSEGASRSTQLIAGFCSALGRALAVLALGAAAALPAQDGVTWNSLSAPTTASPGQTVTIQANVTNSGSSTWDGDYYLALSANGTGIQFPGAGGVSPGQSRNVTFTLTLPAQNGTYTYDFQALHHNVAYFGPVQQRTISVTSTPSGGADGMAWNYLNAPTSGFAGQTISVPVSVTNTGSSTWGANHYLVVTDQNGTNLHLPSISGVSPGGQKQTSFSFALPATAGTYAYTFRALQHNVAYFGPAETRQITVTAPVNSLVWEDINAGQPLHGLPGAAITFTARVRNTGNSTWGPNHYAALVDAQGAGVAFPSVSGVAPNGTKTVSFVLPLPADVGTYTYHFKGLEHNVAYFGAEETRPVSVASTVTGNGLAFISVTPTVALPGAHIVPRVRVRNIGTTTWGAGYYLDLFQLNGVQLPPQAIGSPAVPPQGEVEVSFPDGLTLPLFEGDHAYKLKGEQQGTEYFGETQVVIRTSGASPGPEPLASTDIATDAFTAQWTPIPGVTGYRMDVATSWNFAPGTIVHNNLPAGSGASFRVTGLQAGREYFFRMRAESGAGIGPDGPTQRTETYGVNDIWLNVASDGQERFKFRLGAGGSIADAFSSGVRFMSDHKENDTDGVWGWVLRARGLNAPGAGEFNINLSGGYSNRLRGDPARLSRIMEVRSAPNGVEIFTIADRQWEQAEENFAEGKFSAYVRYEAIDDGPFKILKVRNVVYLGPFNKPGVPNNVFPQNVHWEASWMAFDSATGMTAYGGRDRGKPIAGTSPPQFEAVDFLVNGSGPTTPKSYHEPNSHYNSHVGWDARNSQGFYVAFNAQTPTTRPALAIVFGNKGLELINTTSGTPGPGQTSDASKHALDVKHWDVGFALLPVLNLEKNTEVGGVIDYTYYLIGDAYLSPQLMDKVELYANDKGRAPGAPSLVPVQRFYGPNEFPEGPGDYTGSDPLKLIVNKLKLNMLLGGGDPTIHPSLAPAGGGSAGGGSGGGDPTGGRYVWQKVGEHTEVQKTGEHTELRKVGEHTERRKVGEHTARQAVGQHTERQVVGQHTERQVVGQHTETVVVGQHTERVVVGQHTETVVVGQHTEMQVVGQHEESSTNPDTGETTTYTVDDYGEVTVDDYGDVTVDDYADMTVDDYGTVTVDDYADVTVDDYGEVVVTDYADVVVEDFVDVVVEDFTTVVVEDFATVTVDDYDWVWVPGP